MKIVNEEENNSGREEDGGLTVLHVYTSHFSIVDRMLETNKFPRKSVLLS